MHGTPGPLSLLTGNVKITDSQNVGIVVPFTESFDFLSVHRIEANAPLLTIFLGELNGNNGAACTAQKFAESGGVHWSSTSKISRWA